MPLVKESLTPQSAPVDVAAAGDSLGTTGDTFGSLTASSGTELMRVGAPKAGYYTRCYWTKFCNKAAAEQTLTVLVELARTTISTDAAAGQAVINFSSIPSSPVDGSLMAANDYFIVQNELYEFDVYRVASISSLAVTVDVSIGSASSSGVATKLLAGSSKVSNVIYFMGAVADHTKRKFTIPTSNTDYTLANDIVGIGTGVKKGSPLLLHFGNVTTQSVFTGAGFGYVKGANG